MIADFRVISIEDSGRVCGVRTDDRAAAAPSIAADDIEAYYRGLQHLLQLSEDPGRILHRTLQPGDIAIFDNHRVLHGRTDLTNDGNHWLQWVQLECDDFHSSLRILADRLGLERDAAPMLRGACGSSGNGGQA